MNQLELIIETAHTEVGYLEKKSNAQLDDKTANAGTGNYTKYWRDMRPAWNGLAWCACFISWCARQAGIEETVIPTFYDCDVGMNWYKTRGRWHLSPLPGDIVFFGVPGDAQHVGIVTDVKNGRVFTIEGNTSGGNTLVANGGGVAAKNYSPSYAKILGYGRPDYVIKEDEMTQEQFKQKYVTMITQPQGDNPSDWAQTSCDKAKLMQIFKGDGNGNYNWDTPVSREALAVILDRLGLLK